jgi:anthranilate phosphoribosyltransferase
MNNIDYLKEIISGRKFNSLESEELIKKIIESNFSPEYTAAMLAILSYRSETVDEIYGFAKVMRQHSRKINLEKSSKVVDTCGTGGDNLSTFNISTASAFCIAAHGGVKVAKHGGRMVSSISGSADILNNLGVKIDLDIAKVKNLIYKVNIGFLFAPLYHDAMKSVALIRKNLGVRTIFNLLGPLLNPASANYQIIGVSSEDFRKKIAEVLIKLGTKRSLVVSGHDGLDEISLSGPTKITEVNNDSIKNTILQPSDFGFKSFSIQKIQINSRDSSIKMFKESISGKYEFGSQVIAANAGAVLYILDLVNSLKEGSQLAYEIIKSGLAYEKLEEYIKCSNQK